MSSFDELLADIRARDTGNDGKLFEVFCKWFLEKDPEWSKIVHKVWLWADYPKKWQRQDLGTDLVFEDTDGRVWAVQAKCYAEHRTTTKRDMNSFLADSSREVVSRRLWLQTTNRMEQKAEKTLIGQDKPVTVFKLNDFRNSNLEYPSSFADIHSAKPKAKPKPDPHQDEAIKAVVDGLEKSDRGQMIMACGTGKTFTTLWIKEAMDAQTTLVLLPSLNLLSQTMREWSWGSNSDFDILNVCSDKSVGKTSEDMSAAEAPFPVTSEPQEIAAFLKKPSKKVLFCTYQSSPLIAEVQENQLIPAFDLAIADEAHRCAGKADASFSTILDALKIRSKKRLFTTATPRYFGKNVRDAARLRDQEIVGMDDEDVFGPVIHTLTFGEAIQRELLNDYQVVVVGVDEPRVKSLIENNEILSTNPDKHTDARTLAAKIGLIKAIKDYDLKRVISFHSRVMGAKDFSEEFNDVVSLIKPIERPQRVFLSDFVSGEMKTGDRLDKIQQLKSLDAYDRGVICNARCLAEGVDVPSLDGIAFIDPKGSQIEIIQAVGRAIRKVRGAKVQTKGTIVIPVFIEEGDNVEASIEASNFKPVWDVLNALRAHDEILAETLDRYRAALAEDSLNAGAQIEKITFDLPTTVEAGFAASLRTVVAEASTSSWEFWFAKLILYKNERGDCLVPRPFKTTDGYALGNWVGTQRNNKSQLSAEKVQRLEEISFIWDATAAAWEKAFEKLKKYKIDNGNCLVPDNFLAKDGFSLGKWVGNQRTNRQSLSSKKIEDLESLGFVWEAKVAAWEAAFIKLIKYKQDHGDCLVPQRYKTADGLGLGTWTSRQRRNRNSLSKDRIQRLEALGFIWDVREKSWEDAFAELQKYKHSHGHCRVLKSFKTADNFKLGAWVTDLRNKKSTLSSEEIERLDEIGFIWDPYANLWEEGLSELTSYKKQNGDCFVPKTYVSATGHNLGGWVGTQRTNKEKLSKDRFDRLNDLGFCWDTKVAAWEMAFKHLQAYQKEFGNCLVPQKYKTKDGFSLGSWVSTQRVKRETLVSERKTRLNSIGFEWAAKR